MKTKKPLTLGQWAAIAGLVLAVPTAWNMNRTAVKIVDMPDDMVIVKQNLVATQSQVTGLEKQVALLQVQADTMGKNLRLIAKRVGAETLPADSPVGFLFSRTNPPAKLVLAHTYDP